jgi:iron(III) transport system substrate-binding protein
MSPEFLPFHFSPGKVLISMLGLPRCRLAVFAAAVAAAGCGDGGRVPLVVYSPHGRDLLKLAEEEFEAANPGVDVRTLDMGSQEALDRIRSERANPQADVWFGGPSSLFARAAADSLLEPYRPQWADHIPERGRGAHDLFFSVYQTPAIIAYNDSALAPSEVPRDWDDVLAPRWRGRVVIRNPVASGTMRAIFGMVMLRGLEATGDTAAGFEWLRRLDVQTADYPMNAALLHQKLLRQEGVITLWGLPDILVERRKGQPFAYVLPSSGTPVIEDAIALVRGAKRPELARRFVEWAGSREAQLLASWRTFRLPARTDLAIDSLPDWAQDVMENLRVEDMDWAMLAERGGEWMAYWDRNVRGRGTKRPGA